MLSMLLRPLPLLQISNCTTVYWFNLPLPADGVVLAAQSSGHTSHHSLSPSPSRVTSFYGNMGGVGSTSIIPLDDHVVTITRSGEQFEGLGPLPMFHPHMARSRGGGGGGGSSSSSSSSSGGGVAAGTGVVVLPPLDAVGMSPKGQVIRSKQVCWCFNWLWTNR
jgi:hypothetical protein